MSSEDDGYVHRPGAARDDGEESAKEPQAGGVEDDASAGAGGTRDAGGASETGSAGDTGDADGGSVAGAHPANVDREMGARGWVLVVVLGFCLLAAPALIIWRPPGLPYWAALLALPMVPAILLGAVGVWATTRP